MSAGSKRVLLVEDDRRMAALIGDMLEAGHYEVDGPYATLSDAAAAMADHIPDCAVLDVRLEQGDSAMIANDLKRYGVPFILCSGAEPAARLAGRFPDAPFVRKDQIDRLLLGAVDRSLH